MAQNKMARLKSLLITIVIASIIAIVLAFGFITRGESLYDCEFRLSADKSAYKVGEEVILTAEITPRGARSLTLSQELYQNIVIRNLQDGKGSRHDRGTPVRYRLTPKKPLRFEIRGRISTDDHDTVWVDFGGFGRALIKDKQFPELRFKVLPYRIPMPDSVEWGGSNELQLQLEQ